MVKLHVISNNCSLVKYISVTDQLNSNLNPLKKIQTIHRKKNPDDFLRLYHVSPSGGLHTNTKEAQCIT